MLFACFIPFQIVLIPMATHPRAGCKSRAPPTGLVLVHVVYGIGFSTLYFRNYYAAFPTELVRAAQIDGAGFFQIFWRILLPSSGPIAVVCVIWQFTNIWNDFLFGASFASGDGGAPMTVALNNLVSILHGRERIQRAFRGRDPGRDADAARLYRCGALLRARPHGREREGMSAAHVSQDTCQGFPKRLGTQTQPERS